MIEKQTNIAMPKMEFIQIDNTSKKEYRRIILILHINKLIISSGSHSIETRNQFPVTKHKINSTNVQQKLSFGKIDGVRLQR